MFESKKAQYVQLVYYFMANGMLTVARKKMPRPKEEFRHVLKNERNNLRAIHSSKQDLYIETEEGMVVIPWSALNDTAVSIVEV